MYYSYTTCPYLPCPWAWTPTQGPWISQFWEKSTWKSWTIPCIYFFIKYVWKWRRRFFLSFKHISIFTLLCKILHNKDWEAGKCLFEPSTFLVPSYGMNLWSRDHKFHNWSRGLHGHHAWNLFCTTWSRRGDDFWKLASSFLFFLFLAPPIGLWGWYGHQFAIYIPLIYPRDASIQNKQ